MVDPTIPGTVIQSRVFHKAHTHMKSLREFVYSQSHTEGHKNGHRGVPIGAEGQQSLNHA